MTIFSVAYQDDRFTWNSTADITMKIIIKAIGTMRNYFGEEPVTVKLSSEATLEDFFVYFHNHFSCSLPDFLWNSKRKRFRGAVMVMIDNKVVTDPRTQLRDGNSIQLFKAMVGG
jgi:hypothetical protein